MIITQWWNVHYSEIDYSASEYFCLWYFKYILMQLLLYFYLYFLSEFLNAQLLLVSEDFYIVVKLSVEIKFKIYMCRS